MRTRGVLESFEITKQINLWGEGIMSPKFKAALLCATSVFGIAAGAHAQSANNTETVTVTLSLTEDF